MMFALLEVSSTTRNWAIAIAVVLGLLFLGRRNERRARVASKKALSGLGFDTVAGCEEAVDDLREIVEFLRTPERFERLGATVPKGAVLVGPPGTGKTLLARAVAAEAEVPFIAASATDFVEMYVGVGAKRVRELYERARSEGPAIVFIDEIDAIARARSMNDRENGTPGGPIEHENTLIALLTELDGFNTSNVITLAATNRPDVLDPALTRPGRLERRIEVPLPDQTGRTKILAVHAAAKPLDPSVDLAAVSRRTPGFSGADLSRVCNEAALEAVRRNLPSIDQASFDAAVELVAMGRPRFSAVISEKDRKITAWHEAGHALCGLVQPAAANPVAVSITPRGPAAGVTWFEATDQVFVSKEAAFAQLVVALGGRAAEEKLMGGSCTQGAQGDLAMATDLAAKMVASYGFGSSLIARSPSYLSGHDEYTRAESERLLHDAHTAATAILDTYADALESIAAALLERDRLSAAELAAMVPNLTPASERSSGSASLRPTIHEKTVRVKSAARPRSRHARLLSRSWGWLHRRSRKKA
jgi:cell division protease FtsH